jgi:hypothetical protein
MVEIFDIFGDPMPANWGQRGRPQHVPTQQNRNKVSMLLALGWGMSASRTRSRSRCRRCAGIIFPSCVFAMLRATGWKRKQR